LHERYTEENLTIKQNEGREYKELGILAICVEFFSEALLLNVSINLDFEF
jgi:hypothetical protein